jgi:hypothetical protein
MPMTKEDVQAECRAALADADLASERVRFFHLIEIGKAGMGAAWFRPYTSIEPDDPGFPGDDAQREEANNDANRALHRITVPAKPDGRVLFAALLRHELEHARQWDAQVGVFELQDFLECEVLPEIAEGLDGCRGWLINTMPSEMDCNAAASVYIAGRFSDAEIHPIRNGPNRYLACSRLAPPPPETLPARMSAFAYIHREAVDRIAARRGYRAAMVLRSVHPQAQAYWARLEDPL